MIQREYYLNKLISWKDKKIIKVITGIRRSGKSTLLELYSNYLTKNHVDKNHIIKMNFDNPTFSDDLKYKNIYNIISEKIKDKNMYYILLDEIQEVEEFQKAVNGLFLLDNVDIYITGSNSHMMSSDLSTYLTGRYIEIHMLPLSFREFMQEKNMSENKGLELYIKEGGFPYILNLNDNIVQINNYLESIYNTVLIKDVISRNKIQDIMMLQSITSFIFDSIGQILTTKKISDTLNSNGRKNSINTIENYINDLIEAYIFYKVPRYDIRGKKLLSAGYKYYVSDIGLRNYILGGIRDRGRILENLVFLELLRKNYKIYVGKIDNIEIDFIVKNETGIKYIQVSQSVRDENTLKRELKPLKTINNNYPKYLITMDYDTADYDGIKQINIYDFLLGKIIL